MVHLIYSLKKIIDTIVLFIIIHYNLFGALNKAKLFVYLTIQVLLELSLIRDCDEVEQLVFSGWEKYYPKILNMSKAPQTDNEYHALIIIDKKLRPNGSRNSAPAAFSFHKVRSLSNMIEQHLVNFNTKDNVLSSIPGRYST